MPQSQSTSPQQVAASAICRSLHRAYRDLRLYPPDHPTARQSFEDLATAVARYAEQWGTLNLEVEENALVSDEETIYLHETSRDNLAFLMFRDGVRSLSLYPGVDVEEIGALVDCLAHADDLADMEHDFVTALWERDLSHIDYRVVDPFLGGQMLQEGMVDALRETVLRRLEAAQIPALSQGNPVHAEMGQVTPVHVAGESLKLSLQEAEEQERAVTGLSLVLPDFAQVLLEIAGHAPVTAADVVLSQSLTAVVAAFLDIEDVAGASFVLERLRQMEAESWCPRGFAGQIAGDAISADHVRRLLQHLGQVRTDRSEEIERFLGWLRPWIFPSLLEILAETDDRTTRKMVLGILGDEDGVPWRDLEPFLKDSRWYVVRNAVQLAADAGHTELTDHAQRLLLHADVRVRREVVHALGRLGGQAALTGLAQALSDSDPSVRTLAARAIGRQGGPGQEGLLLAHIEDRRFPSLQAEEMEAFFEAYAELGQERAVPLLDRSWRKGLLSSRPVTFRVAAVLALGRVRGPAARAACEAAAKSGDPQIRRAAAQAAQSRRFPTSPSDS
jgi:hypothetical protein